jgi:DNA-binding PadR family transcriptional regulator
MQKETAMSVRQSLLAILDQGPCYGYQLRAEFDRRTGSTWPLNVGQIYNTLDRLERDGLVEKGDVDPQGHVYWQITDAGSAEVAAWLASPVERGQGTRDELAIKLAVAATLPGVQVGEIIQTQRRASLRQLQELNRAKYAGADPEGPEQLAWSLVVDSMIFAAEAEVRWLDHTEQRLALRPDHAMALELSTDKPKRGRPAKDPEPSPAAVGAGLEGDDTPSTTGAAL